jgi:hypothetical protein
MVVEANSKFHSGLLCRRNSAPEKGIGSRKSRLSVIKFNNLAWRHFGAGIATKVGNE